MKKLMALWFVAVGVVGALLMAPAHAGFFGSSGTEPVQVQDLDKLKKNGIKQVVVPYFRVNVLTKLNKTAKSSSGLFGGGKASAKSSMFTQWSAPDSALLQKSLTTPGPSWSSNSLPPVLMSCH